ncbi:PREDICTED: zinc finger BED domain-containing protein RICESLEEPER 2-like [Camelina sativa]|uniref:Zinc finger BED domain-containing protein RICESLEEPER 2-like n=1 Tax=Camelina sativa TaxID=90675 RepID=A0ABM0YWJ7_CAMSA|nr:PREDICTED: zinc finger BED domain-containing protein RICESLEEPER 2-like [Camelina sativa]
MRCCAHILNLIVRDGLHELSENVTAIRNAVQYVRSSTSRCDSFEQKVVSGKMTRGSLPLDIKTRWNSTYLMLSRAIDFRVAFDRMEAEDKMYNDYFNEVEIEKTKIGPPTRADWNVVERLVRFLIIFYNSTLVVSASTSVASYKCYGEIVTIERNLMSLSNSIDSELKSKADVMLLKFDKCWDGFRNINVFLIVASVFDPRKKIQFAKMCFDKLYGKDTTDSKEMSESITTFLTSLFKEYSNRLQKVPSGQSSQSSTQTSTSLSQGESTDLMSDSMGYERMDFVYKELVDEIGVDDGRDELDVYLKEKVENPRTIVGSEWDVLSWWRLNSGRYPVLSEIARDVLAMQVSSVASESAFSTSGRVIEPHRSCLTHYRVEVLICTQQWMKNENHLGEKGVVMNTQLLVDIELLDKPEKGMAKPTLFILSSFNG